MNHVIAVLEQIENGLLDDVNVIEPYACEGGCFGSPLLFEDHHVAARRWEPGPGGGRGRRGRAAPRARRGPPRGRDGPAAALRRPARASGSTPTWAEPSRSSGACRP